MKLHSAAQHYANTPSDVEALTSFMQALESETSIQSIVATLALGCEQVTAAALSKLVDLLPTDVDFLLSAALWKYHLGIDEEAHQFLRRAKDAAPLDLRVFQVEIFLNYEIAPEELLSLCCSALQIHPADEWLLTTRAKIEEAGRITELIGPPLDLQWQKIIFAAA
jgi:hypothetical protein